MKNLKYLNVVLTVIAVCLVLITSAVIGIIPKANAGDTTNSNIKKFVTVPLNSDGSINVKVINGTMDVNIDEVGGYSTYGKVPVEIQD